MVTQGHIRNFSRSGFSIFCMKKIFFGGLGLGIFLKNPRKLKKAYGQGDLSPNLPLLLRACATGCGNDENSNQNSILHKLCVFYLIIKQVYNKIFRSVIQKCLQKNSVITYITSVLTYSNIIFSSKYQAFLFLLLLWHPILRSINIRKIICIR